ncbi:MAG: nicotinamide-nucleotide amidase [Candidatus Endobugula sp.]|jgi:nicotinamide-nucleotide amidase
MPLSIISSDDEILNRLCVQLGRHLLHQCHTITTAESCTGGGVAHAITSIVGSSQWFSHGFITYSNVAKQQLLQVGESELERYGAVSSQVAEAMACGAIAAADADVAIAVTGIAGPGGGSEEKPVGTVWIAWAKKDLSVISQAFIFEGDRKGIRYQTVIEAIKGALTL